MLILVNGLSPEYWLASDQLTGRKYLQGQERLISGTGTIFPKTTSWTNPGSADTKFNPA